MKNVCFFSLPSSLKSKNSKWLKEWSSTMSPKSLFEETLSIHWLSTVTVFHASLLYEFQHVLIKKKVVILDHTIRVTLSRKHTITFFFLLSFIIIEEFFFPSVFLYLFEHTLVTDKTGGNYGIHFFLVLEFIWVSE